MWKGDTFMSYPQFPYKRQRFHLSDKYHGGDAAAGRAESLGHMGTGQGVALPRIKVPFYWEAL